MTTDTVGPEPIDTAALEARYLAERDKRLRDDGNDQYVEPTGTFAHYLDDPYVPVEDREPLTDEVEVVPPQDRVY